MRNPQTACWMQPEIPPFDAIDPRHIINRTIIAIEPEPFTMVYGCPYRGDSYIL